MNNVPREEFRFGGCRLRFRLKMNIKHSLALLLTMGQMGNQSCWLAGWLSIRGCLHGCLLFSMNVCCNRQSKPVRRENNGIYRLPQEMPSMEATSCSSSRNITQCHRQLEVSVTSNEGDGVWALNQKRVSINVPAAQVGEMKKINLGEMYSKATSFLIFMWKSRHRPCLR